MLSKELAHELEVARHQHALARAWAGLTGANHEILRTEVSRQIYVRALADEFAHEARVWALEH